MEIGHSTQKRTMHLKTCYYWPSYRNTFQFLSLTLLLHVLACLPVLHVHCFAGMMESCDVLPANITCPTKCQCCIHKENRCSLTLKCQSNSTNSINDLLHQFTGLCILKISSSFLQTIPLGVCFHKETLVSLDLSHNNLDNFSLSGCLYKLQMINLDYNNLTTLPPNIIQNFADLHSFSASYNNISKLLESTFSNLANLSHISLVESRIHDIHYFAFGDSTTM